MHACTLANERQCICAVAAATGHAYGVSDARQGGCLEAIRVYGVDGVGGVYDNEGVDGVYGVDGARRVRGGATGDEARCVLYRFNGDESGRRLRSQPRTAT